MSKNKAIILAAGQGTRMKSNLPKVLHKVCGKPMVNIIVDEVKKNQCDEVVVVIGKGADQVKEEVKDVVFALQSEQLGTGHAVMQAEPNLTGNGHTIVLCGDTPLITTETIASFMDMHIESENDISVLTALFDNPFGYGRIVKDAKNEIEKIVEQKDCTDEEVMIQEINSGIYCFKTEVLREYLNEISNNNAQNEYYLTDIITIGIKHQLKVGTQIIANNDEIMGVNSRVHLAEAEEKMRARINQKHMENGVTLINPRDTYIDLDIKVGRDTMIYPGVLLQGKTEVGEDCLIGHNCRIVDSIIKNGVEIQSSTVLQSQVGEQTTIGPYAYLRPNTELGKKVKIGDFVEVKNSKIGDGSKASHLAYIGDADVGKDVNIGCGVVFVNYDGENKFRTVVEDNGFIGSNSNLVAPLTVKKDGYVAAGSTITKDVEAGSLCVERSKQKSIENWVYRKKKNNGGK